MDVLPNQITEVAT